MNDRWSTVLQFGAAALAFGTAAGYALRCWRPLHKAREWASWEVALGNAPGRIRGAPIIWHRIRHGAYPQPPRRRTAPVPALVNRRPTEGDQP